MTQIEIIIEQIGGRINGFINSSCLKTVSIPFNQWIHKFIYDVFLIETMALRLTFLLYLDHFHDLIK